MYKVIDAHCDTASKLLDNNWSLDENETSVNMSRLCEFQGYVQFFAAYVSKEYKNPMLRAVEILNKAKEEIKKNNMHLILNSEQLEKVINEGLLGGILAIEDGRALCGSLSALNFFYEYGVRALTLAWNDDNEITDGAASVKNTGLTDFGKKAVHRMNELKMAIDVSHISEKGFYDVLEESTAPVFASHSNCFSVCNHRRNLRDLQIKALIEKNGVMCINVYPEFLENNPCDATCDSVIKHIEHALSLGGENNLGLGSDFDGIEYTLKDVSNPAGYEKLFEKMIKIGYNKELIDKITYKNIISFMRKVEKGKIN